MPARRHALLIWARRGSSCSSRRTTAPTAAGATPRMQASFSTAAAADSSEQTTTHTMDGLKATLLQESLQQVPEHGWTRDAIAAAASSSSGASMACAGLISVPDLIAYSMDRWNEQLQTELRNQKWNASESPTDKIVWALQRRLSYVQDLVQAGRWHEGMAMGAHPDSLMQTQGQLAALMDIVLTETCPSDEFSIIERFSLGAVYVAVELHMLSDKSTDYVDTWSFLKERVGDWEKLRSSTGSLPIIPNVSNLLQSHSASDIAFTASAVGSALASGAMSILMINSNPLGSNNSASSRSSSSSSSSGHPYTGQGEDFDGTHPSHYDAPNKATTSSSKDGGTKS